MIIHRTHVKSFRSCMPFKSKQIDIQTSFECNSSVPPPKKKKKNIYIYITMFMKMLDTIQNNISYGIFKFGRKLIKEKPLKDHFQDNTEIEWNSLPIDITRKYENF